MIDWDKCEPLIRKEFDHFIGVATPFLKDMECKNTWDFYINDMSLDDFCRMFIWKAWEMSDLKECQEYNPKVTDLHTVCDIISEYDWKEDNGFFRQNKNEKIWEIILLKVNEIADSVFSE